jgi:hypothetical protein
MTKLIDDEDHPTTSGHGRSGALFSTGSHSTAGDMDNVGLPTGAVTWLPDGRDGAKVSTRICQMVKGNSNVEPVN